MVFVLSAEQSKVDVHARTLIVIEDDPRNAEILEAVLQEEGTYQTLRFSCSEEVFEHLDRILSHNPLLFLIDYLLPGMNGLQLAEQLRVIKKLEETPILLLTGRNLSEAEKVFLAQRHLLLQEKPYDIDDLLAHIQRAIAESRTSDHATEERR